MPSFITYLAKRIAYPFLYRPREVSVQLRILQAAWRTSPPPSDASFDVFTYHGEDGLLFYLVTFLQGIPFTFVDIGAGDCVKSNCAMFAAHLGWSGTFIDANRRNIAIGRAFYTSYPTTHFAPPRFVCASVNKKNINSFFDGDSYGILSIDIDGDDYAIWEALTARPWIVIIEARVEHGNQDIVDAEGASVPALCALAARKGYVLAAWNLHGYNLIFVRSDLVNDRVFARVYPAPSPSPGAARPSEPGAARPLGPAAP